jgi:hypothetical protein
MTLNVLAVMDSDGGTDIRAAMGELAGGIGATLLETRKGDQSAVSLVPDDQLNGGNVQTPVSTMCSSLTTPLHDVAQ